MGRSPGQTSSNCKQVSGARSTPPSVATLPLAPLASACVSALRRRRIAGMHSCIHIVECERQARARDAHFCEYIGALIPYSLL
jgi:hypothetical protein